jgi:hypothetical protein
MICPNCRDVASFHEHRDTTFTTLLGDARVEVRPYYTESGNFVRSSSAGCVDWAR